MSIKKDATPQEAIAWFAELLSLPNYLSSGPRATMYNLVNDQTFEVYVGGEMGSIHGYGIEDDYRIETTGDLRADLEMEIAELPVGVWLLVTWRLVGESLEGENCFWFTVPPVPTARTGKGVETRQYFVSIRLDQGIHSATKFHFFMGQISLALLDLGHDINEVRPVVDMDQDCAVFNVTDQVAFAIGMAIGTARAKSADMGMVPDGAFPVQLIPHYLPDSMAFHEIWKKAKGGEEG